MKSSTFEEISTPKRVLHVIHRMRPGGVQTLIMNLYRHMDRSQIQFDFAVRSQQPDYYDEEIKALGGRLFHLPWDTGNPFSLIFYKRKLATILRNYGPFFAVHSHVGLFSGHVLPLARQANVPLCLVHSHSAPSGNSSIVRDIWGGFMRRSIRNNATYMLTCSLQAADWLYGVKREKDMHITKFPNAIDLTPYSGLGSDRLKLRKIIGLPEKGLLIGHIGRFDSVKNHAFLLKLFSALPNNYPDARLILVGEGKLKRQVEKWVEAKGLKDAVIFLGIRADIPQILGAMNLLVLPSLHEGFGIVIIEAQAAGIPCLASDGVSPEVDLGLGLVHFKSLSASIDSWVQQAIRMLNTQPVHWDKREKALKDAGYDIGSSVKLLQNLYLTETQLEDR